LTIQGNQVQIYGQALYSQSILKQVPYYGADYDAGFGVSLATISNANNTKAEKVLVHGTKCGVEYASDAATGKIIWKLPVGIQYNPDVKVTANCCGPVIPGSQGGVEYATANDNKTA
jgi:glucose dehydrogenase